MTLANLDLSIPWHVALSLGNAALFPLWLWLTQWHPRLDGSHALRFLVSAIVSLAVWVITMFFFSEIADIHGIASGLMVMLGMWMFYLQVWGFMNRGYTLGILLTLFKSGRPMTSREIFDGYRDGDGLEWIMKHRIGGLVAAGFLRREGDTLTLTAGRGVLVARAQRLGAAMFGLRKTG